MSVSGRRLEFERDVWREVAAPSRLRERPRRRAFVSLATAITGLVVLGLGLSTAAGSVWLVFGMSDRSALAQMSTVLLAGLQSNDLPVAMNACAEGEAGAQALNREDAEAFAEQALFFLNHEEELREGGRRAREAVLRCQGASKRHAEVIARLMRDSYPS